MQSNGTFSGDADYPAWKQVRLDPALMGAPAPINPNSTSFSSVFGGGVYGERTVHNCQDDGQDNAAESPATVQLRVVAGSESRYFPAHTIVVWDNADCSIAGPGCVVLDARTALEKGQTGKLQAVVDAISAVTQATKALTDNRRDLELNPGDDTKKAAVETAITELDNANKVAADAKKAVQKQVALRFATVLTPPEPAPDGEFVSVTLHPLSTHDTWRCGITQTDVVVKPGHTGWVSVGIQHKSELKLKGTDLFSNCVQPGEVIALGGTFSWT
jgi:hypothetical protein